MTCAYLHKFWIKNENWLEMSLLNQEVIGPHFQGMKIVSDVNSAVSNGDKDAFAKVVKSATG